jgi:hypothetical protein
MEEQDKLYIQGFNNGYLLATYAPELAAKITARSNDNSEYFQGLVYGKKEHEREWAKSFSKGNPAKDNNRDLGKER